MSSTEASFLHSVILSVAIVFVVVVAYLGGKRDGRQQAEREERIIITMSSGDLPKPKKTAEPESRPYDFARDSGSGLNLDRKPIPEDQRPEDKDRTYEAIHKARSREFDQD